MERAPRKWWQQLFPHSKHFQCYLCSHSMFSIRKKTAHATEKEFCKGYYVFADDVMYGPVPMNELKAWAKEGRLHGAHLISKDVPNNWIMAKNYEELGFSCSVCVDEIEETFILHPEGLITLTHDGLVPVNSKVIEMPSGAVHHLEEYLSMVSMMPNNSNSQDRDP